MRVSKTVLVLLVILAAAPVVVLVNGCAGTIPRRNPTGEPFPTVVGRSLEKERVELPSAFAGAPAILIVGYEQSAQFDIDRWLMGLLRAEVRASIVEVPTIPGIVPTIVSRWIDEGMRSGIPKEDWGAVVTLYGGAAEPVAALTGTENGQVARVLVLDRDGRIVRFDDEGYAARKSIDVAKLVAELGGI